MACLVLHSHNDAEKEDSLFLATTKKGVHRDLRTIAKDERATASSSLRGSSTLQSVRYDERIARIDTGRSKVSTTTFSVITESAYATWLLRPYTIDRSCTAGKCTKVLRLCLQGEDAARRGWIMIKNRTERRIWKDIPATWKIVFEDKDYILNARF
jgi:hypothetical protein